MKKSFAILCCFLMLISGIIMSNAAFSSQVSLDFNALDSANMWNFTTKLGAYSPGISNGTLTALNSVKGHGGFFTSEKIGTPAIAEFDVLLKGTNSSYESAYVGLRLPNNTDNPTNSQGVWVYINGDTMYVRSQGTWGDITGSGFSLPRLNLKDKYRLDQTNADGSKKRLRFYDSGNTIYIYVSLDGGASWDPVGEIRNAVQNSRATMYDVQDGANTARGSADLKTLANPGHMGVWLHEHTYVVGEFSDVFFGKVNSSNNGKTYSYSKFSFSNVTAQSITVDNSKMTIAASVPYDAKLWEMSVTPVGGQTITVNGKNITSGTINLYNPEGTTASHTVKSGNDQYTMTLYQQAPPANTGDYLGIRDFALISTYDSSVITDYCNIEDYYDGYEDEAAMGIITAHIKEGVHLNPATSSFYVATIRNTAETYVTVADTDSSIASKLCDWQDYEDGTYEQYLFLYSTKNKKESYMYQVILTYDEFEVINNNRLTTTTLTASDYKNGRNFQLDIFNGVAKDVEGKSYIEFEGQPQYGELVDDADGHAVIYKPQLILGTQEESMSYTVYDANGNALATGRANVTSGAINESDMTSPIYKYTGAWSGNSVMSVTNEDGATIELDFYAKAGDTYFVSTKCGKENCRGTIQVFDAANKLVREDKIDCYYWCGDDEDSVKIMSSPMSFGFGGTWSKVDGTDVYTPYTFTKEGKYHAVITVNTDGFTPTSKTFGVGYMKIGLPEESNV